MYRNSALNSDILLNRKPEAGSKTMLKQGSSVISVMHKDGKEKRHMKAMILYNEKSA